MKKIITIFFLLLFVSCATNKKKEEDYINKSEKELFDTGVQQYKKQNYKNATKNFESLRSIYSHSEFAEKSILYLININIKEKKYSDALILMEDLISEYPGYSFNEELHYDYVMTFYKSVEKQLRDSELILRVKGMLNKFLINFPNSEYRSEIEKEIININNRLIYKEIEVGYFYEVQRNFVAALKRYLIAYKDDSKDVMNSIYTAELLYRIYYCYWMIGLRNEGKEYLNILESKFKNTDWYSLTKLLK